MAKASSETSEMDEPPKKEKDKDKKKVGSQWSCNVADGWSVLVMMGYVFDAGQEEGRGLRRRRRRGWRCKRNFQSICSVSWPLIPFSSRVQAASWR